MKLKIVLLILALLSLVQAAGAIGTISKIDFNVAPGSSEEKAFDVTNPGNESIRCIVFMDDGKYSDWFEFTPDSFNLNAGESKEVKVKVSVPASAKADVHCNIKVSGVTGGTVNTGLIIHANIFLSSPVSPEEPPSKGSSGKSGGGGSPEPAGNVKCSELSQQSVMSGKRVRFSFTQNTGCVGYVEFDAKKSFGKITTLVEVLNARSALTPTSPEGEIYNFLNIWVGTDGMAAQENIGNAVVFFRVSKAWINENNIDLNSITLNHYAGNEWVPLPTKKAGEDDEYLFFEAETPSFSPFAITGEKIRVSENLNITPPPNDVLTRSTGEEVKAAENRSDEEKPGILPGFNALLAGVGLVISGLFVNRRIFD